MKNILLISLILFVFSCKTIVIHDNISGKFYKKGRDYSYSLILNEDSSFIFYFKAQDVKPQCEGRWQLLSKDTILLRCNEVKDLIDALSTGYMPKREHKIKIINRNKLKYNQIVMKRVN